MENRTERMLSCDFIVFAKIYELNQADLGCTVAALVRETALSRPTVLKSIDRLLDLGMAEYEWSWEDGDGIARAFLDLRVTEDAQGLASDLVRAQSENPKERGERSEGPRGGSPRSPPFKGEIARRRTGSCPRRDRGNPT